MRFLKTWLLCLAGLLLCTGVFARTVQQDTVEARELPYAARQTLALIKQGGPYPYARDGAIFGNYEGLLPKQKRGYYHEFTVSTPWARNRGARRIIAGGDLRAPREYYYTDNHYTSFKRIKE